MDKQYIDEIREFQFDCEFDIDEKPEETGPTEHSKKTVGKLESPILANYGFVFSLPDWLAYFWSGESNDNNHSFNFKSNDLKYSNNKQLTQYKSEYDTK